MPCILLTVRVFSLRHTRNSLPVLANSRRIPVLAERTRIRSPAEEGWPELMRAVAYLPFAASYCATMSAGMRPRSLTSRSRSLAQLRISLFLASFALVLRPRVGRPPDLSRPETRLWR